jgi:Zn-dependent protease with chaperone function
MAATRATTAGVNTAPATVTPPRHEAEPAVRLLIALTVNLLGAPILTALFLHSTAGTLAGNLRTALVWIAWSILALPGFLCLTEHLTRGPHAQARWLRGATRVQAVAVAALLASEGVVLFLAATAATVPAGSDAVLSLVGILPASGCLVLAFRTLTRTWRSTARVLRDVDGILVGPERLPQLHARVRRVAAQLGAEVPARILLGLRPEAFVTVRPIALRGRGLLPAAYTLGLPAIALRALTDTELDALIGHELGHYAARGAYQLQRAGTGSPGLQVRPGNMADRLRGLRALAAEIARGGFAGLGLRNFMAFLREQETAADRAGAQVAGAAAVVALLVKLRVLDISWPKLLGQYRRRARNGESCHNLIADHMLVTQQLAVRFSAHAVRQWLLETRTETFDTHPSIAERATALGVKLEDVIAQALRELEWPRETAGLTAFEEELTALEMRVARSEPDDTGAAGGAGDAGAHRGRTKH